jgi:hypothetical protein
MLRLWLAMGVGVLALIVSGVIASMAKAQAGVDPAAVITGYEMARNRRDLDGALAYFADDASIVQRTTSFTGKDEIRKFLDASSTRSRFVVVSDRHTSGNRVTWNERTGGPGGPGPNTPGQGQNTGLNGTLANNAASSAFVVSVEAVVQDGKIRSLAYQATNAPLRTDPSLDGRAQLPASVGLAAVIAVLLGMLMIASSGVRRGAMGASTLRGRLMHDLRGWSAARE